MLRSQRSPSSADAHSAAIGINPDSTSDHGPRFTALPPAPQDRRQQQHDQAQPKQQPDPDCRQFALNFG